MVEIGIASQEQARRFTSRAVASGPAYSRPTADEIEAHVFGASQLDVNGTAFVVLPADSLTSGGGGGSYQP